MRAIFLGCALLSWNAFAGQNREAAPKFTSAGQLVRPDNYRDWIYLSSGLGMTYGPLDAAANPGHPSFDNVFVSPAAYRAFLATGVWPDGTMFALEVRASVDKGSINKGGHYQGEMVALEVEVKDAARFPGKWAYFGFGTSAAAAKQLPDSAGCQACHSARGAVENTFVQFYPTLLPVAKAKATLRPETGR